LKPSLASQDVLGNLHCRWCAFHIPRGKAEKVKGQFREFLSTPGLRATLAKISSNLRMKKSRDNPVISFPLFCFFGTEQRVTFFCSIEFIVPSIGPQHGSHPVSPTLWRGFVLLLEAHHCGAQREKQP
jgi:hypothetical protein